MHLIRITTRVRDQQEALAFYMDKLGFVICDDQPMGPGRRWITVAPTADAAIQIVLQPAEWFSEDERERHLALVGQDPTLVFRVEDCQATYETLQSRGVIFSSPPEQQGYGIQAVARDLYGNSLVFLQ